SSTTGFRGATGGPSAVRADLPAVAEWPCTACAMSVTTAVNAMNARTAAGNLMRAPSEVIGGVVTGRILHIQRRGVRQARRWRAVTSWQRSPSLCRPSARPLLRSSRFDDETAFPLGWQRNPRLIDRSGDQRFHVWMCQLTGRFHLDEACL